jgi:hypothetical protein
MLIPLADNLLVDFCNKWMRISFIDKRLPLNRHGPACKIVTMKKNLSVLVLIAEIVSISLLHAIKIRQAEKTATFSPSPRYTSVRQDLHIRPAPYILLK